RVRFTLNPDAGNHYVITALQIQETAPAVTVETGPGESEVMAMGIVKEVRAAERKLNITHDPIEALGWPTMTMDFEVAAEVDLAGLEPGVRIHFILDRDATGNYVITTIQVME
ncbi:MAG: rane fusion protein, partial [Gammaproteobacteria bacterium]|nr:rane fusion protein [Gammaproteobacteria bacterium]